MSLPELSEKSNEKINEIVNYCKQCFDGIDVYRDGRTMLFNCDDYILNSFSFYASPLGAIDSITVRGEQLQALYKVLDATKNFYGLPIDEIKIENGPEDYLDVHLVIDKSLEDSERINNYLRFI